MKIAFYTLGCKVNQYETELIRESFINNGYIESSFDDFCDVYIINSCTVTAMSDKKSRQMIRHAKRQNPDAIVVVTGCYSQINPSQVASIEGVDIVTGTSNRKDLLDIVSNFINERKKIISVPNCNSAVEIDEDCVSGFADHTRAYVKIQDGCQSYCSYCIIPFTRGAVRSKSPEAIRNEVIRLAGNGYMEIVLTGIHITSYGKDTGVPLISALKMADSIPGDFRLRLGSLEPTLFTSDFTKELSTLKKICPHFHLSLQSGSDSTLKRMNRKYTANEYYDAVKLIRDHFENPSITTDVMVGFPGETEQEFKESLAFVEKVGFLNCHVFSYSKRPNTAAEKMPCQVHDDVKNERSHRMIDLVCAKRREFLDKYTGFTFPVLFEQEISNNVYEGLTPNYITVRVSSKESLTNRLILTEIISNNGSYCEGKIKKVNY